MFGLELVFFVEFDFRGAVQKAFRLSHLFDIRYRQPEFIVLGTRRITGFIARDWTVSITEIKVTEPSLQKQLRRVLALL